MVKIPNTRPDPGGSPGDSVPLLVGDCCEKAVHSGGAAMPGGGAVVHGGVGGDAGRGEEVAGANAEEAAGVSMGSACAGEEEARTGLRRRFSVIVARLNLSAPSQATAP
uniref:Uncharacterized protein n=1 Tax=Oryza barthii TaxID=65489 RepID=A0A0D3G4J9_9ORYZ